MINTLMYARKLEEVGFSREQAETHMQIVTEIVEGNLTTKQDLNLALERIDNKFSQMENKMIQLEYRLTIKLGTIVTVGIGAFAALIKFF